ncbi:hypothetical protein BDV95DRAFT_592722 [Massariosphaeria phaeospora]|uniref:asparaginase n=1 Tax=Massariosphaeria phaeospora TaxID=100035 RepID=A0A7C8I8I1_9PLEO|nr:hypothetical protein BDV95DRAFT_592722 [Massariosphaeria phaeospora]
MFILQHVLTLSFNLLTFSSLCLAAPIALDKLPIAHQEIRHLFTRQDIETPVNASLPNITIFATGGTIASQGSSNTQTTGYSATRFLTSAEDVYNATGIPIVASHRSSDGFVPGDEDDWVIGSGLYNPQKARILLQLALTVGYDNVQIREMFAESYPMP